MTQTKKNRYSDEEKWSAFCQPLQEWMASNEDSEDEAILDSMEAAEFQLNRGNRRVENRPKAARILKQEFAGFEFAKAWKVERLDKTIVKKMTQASKRNRQVHIDFFNGSNRVFTFTKDSIQYRIDDPNVYADRECAKDLTHFKSLKTSMEDIDGASWDNPIYAVWTEPVDDGEEE